MGEKKPELYLIVGWVKVLKVTSFILRDIWRCWTIFSGKCNSKLQWLISMTPQKRKNNKGWGCGEIGGFVYC